MQNRSLSGGPGWSATASTVAWVAGLKLHIVIMIVQGAAGLDLDIFISSSTALLVLLLQAQGLGLSVPACRRASAKPEPQVPSWRCAPCLWGVQRWPGPSSRILVADIIAAA
jgi:hypothetical protein